MTIKMRREFEVAGINDHQLAAIQELRLQFSQLLETVEAHVPAGRERAIVATKLQEACMFAIRGISAPS